MEETLDTSLVNENQPDPLTNLATGWQRFANYLIDMVAYFILIIIVFFVLGFLEIITEEPGTAFTYLIVYSILFLYYFLFEGSNGKTLGKLITKTKVVSTNGMPIDKATAAKRTLCRLIPFDAFSFLGKNGWHDSISNTLVVKDKN
jgi:uncharacterized RDD family membrane protein YckC